MMFYDEGKVRLLVICGFILIVVFAFHALEQFAELMGVTL